MKLNKNRFIIAACLALGVLTAICYWPVTRHQFVNLDDQQYITQNRHVTPGLTWSGTLWAMRSSYAGNWHPLTWVSHMVDCSLFGLNPAGHHLTNLLLHTANTVLLFLLLHGMTGSKWRSAVVAGLFALHPQHVESVAWASERKDVLSAFFFMLTLLSYSVWAGSTSIQLQTGGRRTSGVPGNSDASICRENAHSAVRYYRLALFFFICGLMSKPMLVTTPFVLLLVDYWPLRRLRIGTKGAALESIWQLIREKIPFFLLSLGDSVVTYAVQSGSGSVAALPSLPLSLRLANALVSYCRYIEQMFWPANLAAIYPYPKHWPTGTVIAATIILVAATSLCGTQAKRRPYLLVGWLWYLGMLVPAIGLVQVGPQPMADRYMYLPSIGLLLILVWGLGDLLVLWRRRRELAVGVCAAALTGCFACTCLQLRYWQDGETLFRRALAIDTNNFIAYDGLGGALNLLGRPDEALAYFEKSVLLEPHNAEAQFNLGTALLDKGRVEDAVSHFKAALAANPGYAAACMNLGNACFKLGRLEEAETNLSRAIALDSDNPAAYYNLGSVEFSQGQLDRAAELFAAALILAPDNGEAHLYLAICLVRRGNAGEALLHFSEAVRLAPNDPEMRFNFGLALLEQDRPAEAVEQFSAGLRLRPDDTKTHYRLAVALARLHKSAEAIAHYREALRLTPEFPEARNELAQLIASNAEAECRPENKKPKAQ